MSTVADIMDELQDRIPQERIGSLFPAINRAIGLLSKRLYLLDSDLIIGDLEVNIYAQQTYTAATIAFVDGKSEAVDTITDTASQFVAEEFDVDMPIKTNCAGNEGPFRITAVAAGTLTLSADSSVTAQAAGSSYTITSQNDFGYLPDDFGGLIDKPYVVGYQYPLEPLPSQYVKMAYLSSTGVNTGTPTYYQVKGGRLHIIPATGSDIVIGGDYYKKPAKLIMMDDILPFDGMLDDALAEYLLQVLAGGVSIADDSLKTILYDAVDLIAKKRPKKAAPKTPRGIPWGDL